jgi:tetratricopeptide (TPR) repeat protein
MAALDLDRRVEGAQLFLGEHYARENRYSEALVHLEAAPELEAREIAARVLTALGRLADAALCYSQAIAGGRREVPMLFDALDLHRTLCERKDSSALLHRERREQIGTLIEDAARSRLAADPADATALYWLARALDQDDRPPTEEIEAAWVRALAADPASARVRGGYADFLLHRGRSASARRILRDGLGEQATAESHIQMAEFLSRAGEHEEAKTLLEGAVSSWPGDPAPRIALALALGRAGETGPALAAVREAQSSFPRSIRLLEVAGDLALDLGDKEGADRSYETALAIRPRELPLLRKRIALHIDELIAAEGREGELPDPLRRTEELLRDLLELNRWDREGLRWQAALARARGRVSLALDLLRELLKVNPDEWPARSMRASLLLEAREYAKAMEESLAVIDSGMAGPEDYETCAQAARASGRHPQVVRIAERGLERWPDHVGLLRHLGEAQLALKQGRDFLRRLESRSAAVRQDPDIERLTAWAEVQAGREVEAERRFRRLLGEERLSPGEFARFLFAVGRDEEARAFLRDAAEGE